MRKVLFIVIILLLLCSPSYAWQDPFSGWFSGVKGVMTASTIAADDATPSISSGNVFITSANTGATAITDLDDVTVGQLVIIIGGSATNSSTIADGSNFKLNGTTFTASVDESILLWVKADNYYVEICRSTN